MIAHADHGKSVFLRYQFDIIDLKRFKWTKAKLEKSKLIEAMEANVEELEEELAQGVNTQHQLEDVRKQVTKKIAKQQKEGLQWRNTKEGTNKALSILEHAYEYISNPSYNFIRENSTEAYVPNIIKGMRTTVSELMRQNRELELKLHFAERQKKKYLTKIKGLYEDAVRGSSSAGESSAAAQGAANALLELHGGSSGEVSTHAGSKSESGAESGGEDSHNYGKVTRDGGLNREHAETDPLSPLYETVDGRGMGGAANRNSEVGLPAKMKVNANEAIWPGTSGWRGPNLDRMDAYVPITRPNARGKAVQFLNFLLACNGHFPFEYLFAVTKDDLKECLNFLGAEYVENILRTKGLECAFQNLQETRFLIDINAAVRYLVATISCVLRCDRASYWIVDTNRGFAWTKSAGGTGMQEICIPLDVGLIGEAIATSRAVNVADAYLHPKFNRAIDMRTGYRTRSVLCVPIVVRGKTVAVIQAINKLNTINKKMHTNPIFDERDVFLLHVLGYGKRFLCHCLIV